ncbi:MAG: SIS domain-containing protein, partial [Gemmatimonadota bacterium]|nr:SIS domain-containing protein [Gemmatimonadota bacterium]
MDIDGIRESMTETVRVLERLRDETAPAVAAVSEELVRCVTAGGRILVCGNGGSAADSQHMATELTVRFRKQRRAISALALTVDSSVLTAASNDLGFAKVFSRQVEAHGKAGDVLIAISTSGNSPNVVEAVREARVRGLVTVALTGAAGGALASEVDHWIGVPSEETPQIQE